MRSCAHNYYTYLNNYELCLCLYFAKKIHSYIKYINFEAFSE